MFRSDCCIGVPLVILMGMLLTGVLHAAGAGAHVGIPDGVWGTVHDHGSARIIVRLREDAAPLAPSDNTYPGESRRRWQGHRDRLLSTMPERIRSRARSYENLPFVALDTDEDALLTLRDSDDVVAVFEDRLRQPTLASSGAVIGSDIAHLNGYGGAGTYVAILDTGVDVTHEFFAGKSRIEACFSTTYAPHGATTTCPNGSEVQFGDGAAAPCSSSNSCIHGTHVAGIAVGNGSAVGQPSGVAPDANLVAIQVFSSLPSGVGAYTSDIVAAMEYVYDLKTNGGYNIASVNLSLGGDPIATAYECDRFLSSVTPEKEAADLLRSVGIATVAAAGNDGQADEMSSPGCITGIVGVGSTSDGDAIAGYSNRASWLTFMAPGSAIRSSTVAPSTYANLSGTSMATPQVAGAIAVLRSAAEAGSIEGADDVDRLVATLTRNAVVVPDGATGRQYPRIQLDTALDQIATGSLAYSRVLDTDYAGSATGGSFNIVDDTEGYGGRYLQAQAPAGANRYRFGLELPAAGNFRLFAWWPSGVAGLVSYRVNTGGGIASGTVDQAQHGNGWSEIGAFAFTLPGEAYVEFADDLGNPLAVDAVRVDGIDSPVIATLAVPDGQVGQAYDVQLQVAGGMAPYAWELSDGVLPGGMSLSAGGRLSGTPAQAGAFPLDVRVTDAGSASDQRSLLLTVAPAPNQAPTLTITGPANGATFMQGDAVTFSATADDPESGDLSGSIAWSSDLDGPLGSGAQVVAGGLSVGTHQVTASVNDGQGGVAQQTVTITVEAGQSGGGSGTAIDFGSVTVEPYAPQDRAGSVLVEDGGATLHLSGNAWKQIAFPYLITANTVVEFDYRRDLLGEIHGIGFYKSGASVGAGNVFQLEGTQNWGLRDYSYTGGGAWQHFRIPVGQYYTGQFGYLLFVQDDDKAAGADARFSNLVVYEDTGGNQPPELAITGPANGATFTQGDAVTFSATASDPESGDLSGSIAWSSDLDGPLGSGAQVVAGGLSVGTHQVTASVNDGQGGVAQQTVTITVEAGQSGGGSGTAIDFGSVTVEPYAPQDRAGSVLVEDGGATLHLSGNAWKQIAFPYLITANTVVEFDYRRDLLGEIHGIGFYKSGASVGAGNVFQLEGTQNWGLRDYSYTGGGAWQHFRIPVGQYYTGQFGYLLFVQDDDKAAGADAQFSDVRIYDE